MDLAMSALGLPVSPDLLGIHAGGHRKARGRARPLDGDTAPAALSSVSWRRVRSGSLIRSRYEKRTIHGDADDPGLRADGPGNRGQPALHEARAGPLRDQGRRGEKLPSGESRGG